VCFIYQTETTAEQPPTTPSAIMDAEQLADYLERASKFGLDSLDDVAAAATLHGTIWLDVRSGAMWPNLYPGNNRLLT
jgi:hypothetical protein